MFAQGRFRSRSIASAPITSDLPYEQTAAASVGMSHGFAKFRHVGNDLSRRRAIAAGRPKANKLLSIYFEPD